MKFFGRSLLACAVPTAKIARQMRRFLNDAGLQRLATHNNAPSRTSEGLKKAAERNKIPGSPYVLMASRASTSTPSFEAAESTRGSDYYLTEQEGSRYPQLETAESPLAPLRTQRG